MRCILAKALDHACVPSRLSPSIISPLSHPSLPSSRQLFSAFDSVSVFCFRRSSISAFLASFLLSRRRGVAFYPGVPSHVPRTIHGLLFSRWRCLPVGSKTPAKLLFLQGVTTASPPVSGFEDPCKTSLSVLGVQVGCCPLLGLKIPQNFTSSFSSRPVTLYQ